jgi:hypothetical protein
MRRRNTAAMLLSALGYAPFLNLGPMGTTVRTPPPDPTPAEEEWIASLNAHRREQWRLRRLRFLRGLTASERKYVDSQLSE